MSVTLRPVTEEDYKIYGVYFKEIDKSNEPMSMALWAQHHLNTAQVIMYDCKDVGYIWSVVIKRLCYVFELAVSNECRNKGIGKRAFELLREDARTQGCNSIALHCEESKEAALGLYLRAGLVFVHDLYHVKIDLDNVESLAANGLQDDSITVQPTPLKSDWDHVERRYPMLEGMLETFAGDGYVPVTMTRSNEICGFSILGTEDNMLWRFAVDRNSDIIPFLAAISKMFTVRTKSIPMWIEKNRGIVDYILENVPSAEEFETYRYMAGGLMHD